MYSLLMLLTCIVAVLLIIIVLLQSSKGGGLAGTFGGAGGMGTMFGTRRTADFLSKATWWLGGLLAALALIINLAFTPKTPSALESRQQQQQEQQQQQNQSK